MSLVFVATERRISPGARYNCEAPCAHTNISKLLLTYRFIQNVKLCYLEVFFQVITQLCSCVLVFLLLLFSYFIFHLCLSIFIFIFGYDNFLIYLFMKMCIKSESVIMLIELFTFTYRVVETVLETQ